MSSIADHLRAKARQTRLLARMTGDQVSAAGLQSLADLYDDQAKQHQGSEAA